MTRKENQLVFFYIWIITMMVIAFNSDTTMDLVGRGAVATFFILILTLVIDGRLFCGLDKPTAALKPPCGRKGCEACVVCKCGGKGHSDHNEGEKGCGGNCGCSSAKTEKKCGGCSSSGGCGGCKTFTFPEDMDLEV